MCTDVALSAPTLAALQQQVKMEFEISLEYIVNTPSDFIFQIHAAKTPHQIVVAENIDINRQVTSSMMPVDESGNRGLRIQASPGPLGIRYTASVILQHVVTPPSQISEVPIANMPASVLPYLRASRYCQSDRLLRMAFYEFGHLQPTYERVHAIQNWVKNRVSFRPQASDVTTSAMDTLVEQVGVCRDYAHLMIALCRALNIPARFVTGIDYGADPALGPIDFHAYVEVFLSGRWYIFDPSGLAMPMGFVRLATGRDAADVAFATIFGSVNTGMPKVSIRACAESDTNCILPFHTTDALSTSAP